MMPILLVTPLILPPQDGCYRFFYGKIKGSLRFSANRSESNPEWEGSSSLTIGFPDDMDGESRGLIKSIHPEQPHDKFLLDWLLRKEVCVLGSADEPDGIPGSLPAVPLEIIQAFYPGQTSDFYSALHQDINRKLARLYNKHSLVTLYSESSCEVMLGPYSEDLGRTSTVFYGFNNWRTRLIHKLMLKLTFLT